MTDHRIGEAVASLEQYYRNLDDPGSRADLTATATIESGLLCRIESPDGKAIYTDMPEAVGGTNSANSPGWHLRAALASCDATLLAMRAARQGIELDRIQVRVQTWSDGRGMFLDEGIVPGSTKMQLVFTISAARASDDDIRELVHWVEAHSPVGSDISRAIELDSSLELGQA